MNDDFNLKTTGFWGALAAFFWALPKILEYKKQKSTQKEQKEMKMSESEKLGIKNIQECLLAGEKIGILLIKKAKDGIQLQDGVDIVAALLMDQELRNIIDAAAKDIGQVPKEMGDLDVAEVIQLVKDEAASVERIIAAVK